MSNISDFTKGRDEKMPRTTFRPQRDQDKLRIIFAGYQREHEMTNQDISHILGCSVHTAAVKMKEPERLTLAELRMIQRGLNIPADEIRTAIKF